MPLHPQSQAFLAAVAASGSRGWSQMPLNEARDTFNSIDAFGDGPDLHRVDDRVADTVPVRVYRPAAAAGGTTVVYFHGGGWVLGNVQSHDAVCRNLASHTGFSVVSVDYRCAPEHRYPVALDDSFTATRFVSKYGDELGVDSTNIILSGDSAGGNLACAVSLKARGTDLEIKGQVLLYPVVSPCFTTESYNQFANDHGLTRATMMWFWEQYLGNQKPDRLADLLLNQSFADLPSTHLVVAEYDVLRSECETLAERLKADGVSLTRKQYDGMLHGFVHFAGAFDDGRQAIRDIAEVMKNF